ncbi:GGDEF domain-containing protein [Deinococcus cellulosilyticus]|uniref:GGDEF domain-containing protein n=1 Tax=Deinococcus cellulosilyticus (strain DSM 18568 / NBRC 106333 / KACC 11606 / 5516J-15) TaxID=1223518 RepID=A0A511N8H8_DEIC1|nr:GGDEF domain-containing protein [Deinococcus cellulosilyticus]GEM49145.1 hypothetical protein DC3_47800 [Deinococcus cellulosilyticus NBRC 106333 = KACC 11606]
MDRAEVLHQEELLSQRMVLLCSGVLLCLILLQSLSRGMHVLWWLPLVLHLVALYTVHQWCRNVRPYWLSLTALSGLWGSIAFLAWHAGGLNSPLLAGWPLVVTGATVLLGKPQGLFALGFSALAAVLLLQVAGIEVAPQHAGLVLILSLLTYFLMALSILQMYRMSVQQIRAQQVQHLKIQQAMEISEARNQAILDALPDVVFRVTRDSTILDVNIGEQTRWAIRASTLLGQKVTQFVQDETRLAEALSWVLSGDGMQTQELQLCHPELGQRSVESRMVAVGEDHALLFWRDITERKKIEFDRLDRLRRMEGLDRFMLILAQPEMEHPALLQAMTHHTAEILQGFCVVEIFPSERLTSDCTNESPTPDWHRCDLPLVLHGIKRGVVTVWRSPQTGPFSAEEQSTLQTLVDRTGLTLTNRELDLRNRAQAEELRKANEELEVRIRERTHELARANEQLQELTIRDGLTGIFNRRHFDERLEQEVRRLPRSEKPLGLLLCDIDFFKRYNDHYGHPQGDLCLKQVARLLQDTFRRAGDVVARYGGEEFAVILPNTSLEQLSHLSQRLREQLLQLALPHAFSEVAPHVTLSVGGVQATREDAITAQGLIQAADQAMYCSKHSGRNRGTLRPWVVQEAELPSKPFS